MVTYPMPKVLSGHTVLISAFILLPISDTIHTLCLAFMATVPIVPHHPH